jgi:nitrous oxidase accessory protein
MRRLLTHGALLLALAAGASALADDALASTHLVCPDCAYTSVSAAIAAAEPGDRVVVRGGTYREGTIEVGKPPHPDR